MIISRNSLLVPWGFNTGSERRLGEGFKGNVTLSRFHFHGRPYDITKPGREEYIPNCLQVAPNRVLQVYNLHLGTTTGWGRLSQVNRPKFVCPLPAAPYFRDYKQGHFAPAPQRSKKLPGTFCATVPSPVLYKPGKKYRLALGISVASKAYFCGQKC